MGRKQTLEWPAESHFMGLWQGSLPSPRTKREIPITLQGPPPPPGGLARLLISPPQCGHWGQKGVGKIQISQESPTEDKVKGLWSPL